jgi:hypothetical protein
VITQTKAPKCPKHLSPVSMRHFNTVVQDEDEVEVWVCPYCSRMTTRKVTDK